MTRLRTFFLLSTLLALAAALPACGGGGSSNEDPQKVVDRATLQGVESGELDLSLGIDVKGQEGGHFDISLSGPFQNAAAGESAELDLTAEVKGSGSGENIDFTGGLTLLPGKAFVNYEGAAYEVDPTTYSFIKTLIKQAENEQESEAEGADVTACQEAAANLDIGSFVNNLSNDGSADVGGTSTTKVSGDLDVAGAIDAVVELIEDPACSSLSNGALPSPSDIEKAKSEVQEAVKAAQVDLYVGDDNIVRRASGQLSIEASEGGEGPQTVDIEFELSLTGVNEDQSISAPGKAKPLTDLFIKLGVNPLELAGLLSGEGGGLGNPEEIGGLLEGLGGGSGGGGSSESSGGGGGSRQAYIECIGEASTPVDLQRCAKLR